MFTVALFVIKTTKNTPPIKKQGSQGINKLGYIHTMDYYLAMKSNEQLIYTHG